MLAVHNCVGHSDFSIYGSLEAANDQLPCEVRPPISAIGRFLRPYVALEPAEICTPVVPPWYLPLTRRRPNGIPSTVTGAQIQSLLQTSLTLEPAYLPVHGAVGILDSSFFPPSVLFISKFIQRRYMGQSSVKNMFLAR